MAKALIIVVTLVTLLMEYSDQLDNVENPMQRSHSFGPFAGSNNMENQGKGEERSKGTLETEKKESFSPAIQNDKSLKSAEATLTQEKRRSMLGKVINKSKNPEAKPVVRYDVTASKRVAPTVASVLTKIAGNEQVQKAVMEKGIDVAGKLVDKQLEIIDEAKEKASNFLKKEIKLDITPDKGWATEDMFIPPGYHINAEVESEKKPHESNDPPPYTYPAGMGSMIMNGCWGTGYTQGDPCFKSLKAAKLCVNMIDGAAFIGVGFDGRGEYSPESRKMSIIQRSCGGGSKYDKLQVPDTMNVHGIYDTSASMTVFTSRSEYQTYLRNEAGVSGSFLGFSAGVKRAWGSSKSGAKQTNLAIFDIDVDRYEIFQDEVMPQDLSRSFLREFVGLPTSYFAPGAPAKFQDFILRWGTHYIKSARFGGQLELRKTQLASKIASKEEFAEESEAEFKSLFGSAGAKSSTKSGSSSKSQHNYMSTSLVVQGGSQRIAAVISDMYSPTFKTQFTEWLESIPTYPKAFKFLMGSVTDLLDFRANDLFPEEKIDWGCEKMIHNLKVDTTSHKGYYIDNNTRFYCEFNGREDMDNSLKRKRVSLKRGIEVYTEEGPLSISDVSIPAGKAGCEMNDPISRFKVNFDMLNDLKGVDNGGIDIPKSMSRSVQYSEGKWYTADEDGNFHLYDGFSNGGSGNLGKKKISIFGLVLTYDWTTGSLILNGVDYTESKKYFPRLSALLNDKQLAFAKWPAQEFFQGHGKSKPKSQVGHIPCNVHWSNGLRFDPSDRGGKCLHFTASSKGPLYVVFSAVPSNKDTWYYVEISPFAVRIYKSQQLKVSTVSTNAVALGDVLLYQSYFVCVTESTNSTVIEYGKSQGTTDSGDVYLTMIDHDQPIHARFYSFANGEEPVQIVDSHVISRTLTEADCKGDTHKHQDEPNCVQKCHEACAPLAGCKRNSQGEPKATECNECGYAMDRKGVCLTKCPAAGEVPDKNKRCVASYDLKFKPDTENSWITGFSTFSESTLCFWTNFFNNFDLPKAYRSFYPMLQYFNPGTTKPEFSIGARANYISNGGDYRYTGMELYFSDGHWRGSWDVFDRTNSSHGNKSRWHNYCFFLGNPTYKRGIVDITIDGVFPSKSIIFKKVVAKAKGKMLFGGFGKKNFPGVISGLNIWDRLLSMNEIDKLAQACDGSIPGNVLSWSDIKNELDLSKYTLVSPSKCKKLMIQVSKV